MKKNLFVMTIVLAALRCSSCVCLESAGGRISSARQGFLERWHDFQGEARQFPLWTPDWSEEELKARFDQICSERWSVYFTNPEECMRGHAIGFYKKQYQVPEDWKKWGSRYSYPRAFSYNIAFPSYNASIITLHGKSFLAMEAPTKENQNVFYSLLKNFEVTDLIRLTSAMGARRENSYPYWEGHINIHPKTARPTVELDGREMRYFCADKWEDDQGIEPERLIALVKALMENDSPSQMIGVHCRAGVGRTGAFLAAYALIYDIDRQIANGVCVDDVQVSVDKIIWELSLQRPFMITHFPQYEALYQLVGSYTKALKANPSQEHLLSS